MNIINLTDFIKKRKHKLKTKCLALEMNVSHVPN